MSLMEESKAQSSVETLLLIGAALILAAIVGYFVKTLFMGSVAPLVNKATHQVAGEI